jgi:integrase
MQELAPHLKPIIRPKLYLALRARNLLDLTWDQIDFERELIIIPETKNGEELIQPMIQPLKELSNDLPRRSAYVFCDTERMSFAIQKGGPIKGLLRDFGRRVNGPVLTIFAPMISGVHLVHT